MSQRRLRLRGNGKHHRNGEHINPWPLWTRDYLWRHLATAFEKRMWPKHYGPEEPKPPAYWQMDNYATGVQVWHGRMTLVSNGSGIGARIEDMDVLNVVRL